MAKWVTICGSTVIAGNVRYQHEGRIPVSDAVAERLSRAGVLIGEPEEAGDDVFAVDEGPPLARDGSRFDDPVDDESA